MKISLYRFTKTWLWSLYFCFEILTLSELLEIMDFPSIIKYEVTDILLGGHSEVMTWWWRFLPKWPVKTTTLQSKSQLHFSVVKTRGCRKFEVLFYYPAS